MTNEQENDILLEEWKNEWEQTVLNTIHEADARKREQIIHFAGIALGTFLSKDVDKYDACEMAIEVANIMVKKLNNNL